MVWLAALWWAGRRLWLAKEAPGPVNLRVAAWACALLSWMACPVSAGLYLGGKTGWWIYGVHAAAGAGAALWHGRRAAGFGSGAALVAILPALALAMSTPGLRGALDKGRLQRALLKEVPELQAVYDKKLPASAAVLKLAKVVDAGSEELRFQALRSLSAFAAESAPAVPEMERALSGTPMVRRAAAEALAAAGPAGAAALLRTLETGSPDQRAAVSEAVRGLQWAAESVPQLIAMLKSPSVDLRRAAAEGLSRAAGAESALQELILATTDGDSQVRGYALMALDRLGPKAAPAVPAALRLLDDEDDFVRTNAFNVVGRAKVVADDVLDALMSRLDQPPGRKKSQVLHAIAQLGPPAARRAAPKIVPLLEESDPSTRITILYTLTQLGREAAPYQSAAVRYVDDGDRVVRWRAKQVLSAAAGGNPNAVQLER